MIIRRFDMNFVSAGMIIMVSLAVPIGASAQSLNMAIEATLANSPNIAAASAAVNLDESNLQGARAASLSTLAVNGSYGVSNADFGGGYKTIYPRALSLAWERRLFDGGAALARISAAEFALAAQNGQMINTRNNLIVEVVEAYCNLYAARQVQTYSEEALVATTRLARDAGLQFSAGEISIADKATAEAAMHRAKAALTNAQGIVKSQDANLYRLTGKHFTTIDLNQPLPPLPAGEAFAKETAKENHPLLASQRAAVAASEAQVRIASAARAPNISLSARATSVRDQFLAGYKSDDVGAYVNFSMPLWDSGRAESLQGSARAGRDIARANLRAAERMVEMGVTQSYAMLEAANGAKAAALAALDASQISANATEAQMRVGEKPIIDVLEARARLTEAQAELAKANAALITARYKIIAATGAQINMAQ